MDVRAACDSILETIGETPLVRIRRMNPEPGVVLYAKVEGFNPMGSVKSGSPCASWRRRKSAAS